MIPFDKRMFAGDPDSKGLQGCMLVIVIMLLVLLGVVLLVRYFLK